MSLFDAKFYPYPTVDDDQIFAAAGERDIYICRMVRDADRPFEVLRWFEDGGVSVSSWLGAFIAQQLIVTG